jgi:spore morphogenesis protein SipL/LysM domain-containing protein
VHKRIGHFIYIFIRLKDSYRGDIVSIEIIKEDIKVEELIGSTQTQVLVEKEVYVNTGSSQMENLIWTDARTDILSSKILEGRVLINGLVKFNILYKDSEGDLYTLEEQSDFKEEIEIEGISEEMNLDIDTKIEYIEEEIDENKIYLRAVINLSGEATETKHLEMIKDIEGEDDLQSLKKEVKYKEVFGNEVSYEQIKDTIEVDDQKPPIEKVIKFSAISNELESVVGEDRVIVSGEVLVSMIYLSGGHVHTLKESIPFNHFVEIEGVYNDLDNTLKMNIKDGNYEVLEDEFGDLRKVDLNFNVEMITNVYRNTSRNLIIDIYSTKEKIALEQEEINLKENIDNINYEDLKSFDIDIDAKEILDIEVSENIIDKRYLDGEIVIDGILNANIYYIDNTSDELAMLREALPFKSSVSVDSIHEDSIINLKCNLKDINYILKKESVSIENSISYKLSLNKDKMIYCIKNIEETGEIIDKRNKPSITIYIVQKGDMLWDVAKRYNTTIEEILDANNLESDYVMEVGDKIIIEKKLDLEL